MKTETGTTREYLPPEWSTARIRVKDSQLRDVPCLTQIFNSCHYVEQWDPTFQLVDEDEIRQLVEKSLTDTGVEQGFRLQRLETIDGRGSIGYFHVQHHSARLPQPATAFISMFVIHPEHQGKQYAQEVVAGLSQQLAERGYMAIWLEVYLKNWPALRFWVQRGFNKIIEYDGDKQLSETAQATLILEKRLIIPEGT
ncbi:MAG TPA: GNAT family N-acetyltransferase [Chloroflexota bacterium]|nr:GNAT family N-acetyltransferase [Chloroflexota bacterium]